MPPKNQFYDYLNKFKTNKDEGQNYTHTRIPDKTLNILGGSYTIGQKDEATFYEKYINEVYNKGKSEYLTEAQLKDGNEPILVDFDFRYSSETTERQHTDEDIESMITLYTDEIKKIINTPDAEFEIYIFHKPNVNNLENKTKDGIHMKIAIKMEHEIQCLLREKIIERIPDIWGHLPLLDEWKWSDVLDEGITKGHTNWQLLGYKKPNNESYELTHVYNAIYNKEIDQFELEPLKITRQYILDNFMDFIARNRNHIKYPIKEEIIQLLENRKANNATKKRKPIIKQTLNYEDINYNKIKNEEELNNAVSILIETLEKTNYEIKETHLYCLELPGEYYNPGSYDRWIRVGWALKNTHNKLFLTWVKFSSKSKEFSFTDIPDLYEKWEGFEQNNEDGLTNRSILYWVKNDNPEGYKKVKEQSVEYYINTSLSGATEFDLAQVLYHLYKDEYCCTSIKNNTWYKFENHRWTANEAGTTLRYKLSTVMYEIYQNTSFKFLGMLHQFNEGEEKWNELTKKSNKCGEISLMCKKTDKKNNIMKEAQALFYDSKFDRKLDSNPYLLCCNNGVIDFKENRFRNGLPEDYLSMCTNIDYIPVNKCDTKIKNEIEIFMNQLFPIPELCRYMWEHLASCLIGTNENQTFNIYTGSGRNGKSKLTDLVSLVLGDYVGTVPISLVTKQRNAIGSVSPEIAQLKGKRYAIMQEPTKGDILNEGIMKQITGGDKIDARGLYKDAISFIPQFKLVVCTNNLFDIRSNDEGTWRRIRKCDFMSYFTEEPKSGDSEKPYQFDIDKQIEKKFSKWKNVFLSLLTQKTFDKKGIVTDCKIVLEASNEYRESKDYLSLFVKEKIIQEEGRFIKQTELQETFKIWYSTTFDKNIPKGKELFDYIDKKYGKKVKGKWMNIAINYELDDNESDGE